MKNTKIRNTRITHGLLLEKQWDGRVVPLFTITLIISVIITIITIIIDDRFLRDEFSVADDEETGETVVDQCKKNWKRLRDNFYRVHKKLNTPSGSGAREGRLWPLYHSLTFLLKVKTKNTRK